MLLKLLNSFRRCAVLIFALLTISSVIAVFGARLPDSEICVQSYIYSTTRTGSPSYLIYDTTRGQYTAETRNPNFSNDIYSSDGKHFIEFKPLQDEKAVYEVYLQSPADRLAGRLLQPAIWIGGSNLQSIGDQFRWSRDSKQIAFLWGDRDKNLQLTVANVENSQIKTVTLRTNIQDPSKIFYSYVQEWSADNRYFTVIEQVLNDTYYSFWESETLQPIPYSISMTSMIRGTWSPQGHTFASILRDNHQEATDLMIFDPDKADKPIKVPIPGANYQHLMWSPDSSALVLGNLTCTEANCRQNWHYDLFNANGNSIYSNLTGNIQSINSTGTTLYNYNGRTVISGYDFNATWSDDGKRFVYLEQINDETNPVYSLKTVDLKDGEVATLGTYPVVRSIVRFFHAPQSFYTSTRLLEGIPYVPQSDQFILPYVEAGKVNAVLTGSKYDRPITLVQSADQIEPISNPYGQYQYWAVDVNDPAPILIQWSTGKGLDKRVKLTTANSDGGNIHTFDEGWSVIDDIHLIFNADTPIMGFAGKKDGHFNLYTMNIETGEIKLVLEDVQDVNGWVINMNPQKTVMAINSGSSTANKGALYLRSTSSDSLIEVDPTAYTNVAWSNDGEKLALISGTKDGKQHFRIVSSDGTLINDHVVSNDSTHLFIPISWSKCY